MIKVLQVIDVINQNSGVSSVVMNYFRHMNNPNIRFDFLIHEDIADDLREEIEGRGSKIYRMPSLSGRNIPRYIKELDVFFGQHKGEYDIIHGHIPNAAFLYMSVAKRYGIPIRIIHSHNSKGADGTVKKIRNYILNRLGIRMANKYVACSKVAGEYLFGRSRMKKVKILHNAIDLLRFQYDENVRLRLRKKYQLENKLIIGHVGRFQEQKNHKFIIDLAEQMKKKDEVCFVLLGDGPLREEVENKIKEKKLCSKVQVLGEVSNPQDYYQMMDIFILPSLYEGLPVVGIEAQAAGLPCLFSECITQEIELTKLVHFLSLKNVNEWTNMITSLSTSRINCIGILTNEGFSIEEEAKRLCSMYEKMINEHNS